jgi:pyruvate dehydrogenase E2 component (dihydrolipoamide acetyltransferase)
MMGRSRRPRSKVSGWRKISTATWGPPNDPQIYGDVEVDATNLLAFIDDARAAGHHVTVTHVVGKAMAYALSEHPELNARLYRGSFIGRDSIDIFFIVSAEEGAELSGVKIEHTDRKPVVEIAQELARRAAPVRAGTDVELGKTKSVLARTPLRAMGLLMRFAAWATTDRQMDLPKRGLPREPFGSAMVTSVGMFGIQHAYAPLSPFYRIPFLVLVGEVAPKPVVVGDAVEARPVLSLTATLDHRYVDGFHAARVARPLKEYLEDPKRFEPPLAGPRRGEDAP